MSTVTLQMSTPLDTLDGPLELGLHWVEAQKRQLDLAAVIGPESQETLEWLGLPLGRPSPESVPWTFPGLHLEGPPVQEIRARGILPEMLLAYLVQLAWIPEQEPECRPLSEVVKFFQAPTGSRVRAFDWDELLGINATRLQELTPREFVDAAQGFGSFEVGDDGMLLEAWALLFVEHCQTLIDAARHLCKFWYTPDGLVELDLPADWYEKMENGELTLGADEENRLLVALTGEALGDSAVIVALLGPERCRERVKTKETSIS